MQTRRDMLRDAIRAYRHAEKWHFNSDHSEILEDGFRMAFLAQHVAVLLTGKRIKRKGD